MRLVAQLTYYDGDYKKIKRLCEKSGFEVIIYNKRNSDFGYPTKDFGIDAYDKMHFIINNYYNLPDIVFFTKDSVFTSYKKEKRFKFVLDNISVLFDRSGLLASHISKIQTSEVDFKIDKFRDIELLQASVRPFNAWFKEFINYDLDPYNILLCMKSIFAVTKDLILSNPIESYIKLIEEIEKNSVNGNDSEVPHFMERSYVELFCKNQKNLMFHNFKEYGQIGN